MRNEASFEKNGMNYKRGIAECIPYYGHKLQLQFVLLEFKLTILQKWSIWIPVDSFKLIIIKRMHMHTLIWTSKHSVIAQKISQW